ncbi:hypothetical protein JMUB7550_27550 [Staphylococcus aureus]
MSASLVGSEMCIRDRIQSPSSINTHAYYTLIQTLESCLLYTSDAADDLTRVDLGGRRIIKK